jgi:uncharacterized protein
MNKISLHRELLSHLSGLKRTAVAFSGGVDSTLLLKAAGEALSAGNTLAVIVNSVCIPEREIAEANRLASEMNVEIVNIELDLLQNDDFRRNDKNRCYHCKRRIFDEIKLAAGSRGFTNIIEGSNTDDTADYRPGLKALAELNIRSPYIELNITKADIRTISKELDLPNWNKPSMACLATRIPYGTEISGDRLKRIELAEEYLLNSGFTQVRVRDHYPIARLELPENEFHIVFQNNNRKKIIEKLKSFGYGYVAIDLQGYRSGSMNDLIEKEGR